LNIVEVQPSAAPAHDWNERVYNECYRPNACSRILDANGMILDIYNNYRNLSFNFGPTLLSWMEEKHPVVVQRIIEADRESVARLDGHGNALAQVYNHIIMPLASRRDQLTQIRWAKTFFRSRFGRDPEGIWLGETAINMETVYCLIEEGIRYVVLSPHQAEAFAPLENGQWCPTSQQPIDTRRPYRVFPYTKNWQRMQGHLDVFFFDEGLSRGVSFAGILNSAQTLAESIGGGFLPNYSGDQAVVVATDGETFGHHKAFGDMCLAYFFSRIAQSKGIEPVNFGYYLAHHQPAFEVKLKNAFTEGTAWSCAHGTGRWYRDCGCRTGGEPGWNQKWRTPLRQALDLVQKKVNQVYEDTLGPLVADPWQLRDDFMKLNGAIKSFHIKEMLVNHGATDKAAGANAQIAARLLQAQKFALFSFTSCAWFFNDITGIETIQNLRYAGRALQLALSGEELESTQKAMLDILAGAQSNKKGETGKTLYEAEVLPYTRHLEIISFYAVCSTILAENNQEFISSYGYLVRLKCLPSETQGREIYRIYAISIANEATGEQGEFSMLIGHEQGAHLVGHLLPFNVAQLSGFDKWSPASWTADPHCRTMRLTHLYEETRQQMSEELITHIVEDSKCREWLNDNEKVLVSLSDLNDTLPDSLHGPTIYALNNQWNNTLLLLRNEGVEQGVYNNLLELWKKITHMGVEIDFAVSVKILDGLLRDEFRKLANDLSPIYCDRIRYMLNIVDRFEIPIGKHQMEDAFFSLLSHQINDLYDRYKKGENRTAEAKALLLGLLSFARRMNFNTDRFLID
jgi:alpha-amylase/alpha-mannosidase (GH57 family)